MRTTVRRPSAIPCDRSSLPTRRWCTQRSKRLRLEFNRKSPSSTIELLQAAAPFELGMTNFHCCVYPIYIRGQAYLAAGQGSAAAAEFQKILDHRGLVTNCSTRA